MRERERRLGSERCLSWSRDTEVCVWLFVCVCAPFSILFSHNLPWHILLFLSFTARTEEAPVLFLPPLLL